ncbi:MAG: polymerase sigma-54 factor [Pseudomonadota bacterium]
MAAFLWCTAAIVAFTALATFAKALINSGLPAFEVVFFRNLFATLIFSPLLLTRGRELVTTRRYGLYGWRCFVMVGSMLLWFSALALIPMAELTAISYVAPLFGTLFAALFLGERLRIRRMTALVVGFIGAMIILRPAGSALGLGQLLALLAAICSAVAAILIKQLTSGSDDPAKIVFLTHLITVPVSLGPALFVWRWPVLDMLPMMIGLGVAATLGHLCLTRAYASADASLVMTFEFTKLPVAAFIGYIVFGELIDGWTWVGATIVFLSAFYVTRREAQLRRQAMNEALEEDWTGASRLMVKR